MSQKRLSGVLLITLGSILIKNNKAVIDGAAEGRPTDKDK